MNLVFRLLYVLFIASRRAACGLLGPARIGFRCWFTDLDVLLHMNNAKYLALMDLARLDLMKRSGLYRQFREKDFYPVIVAETIRFRRSLRLLQRFEIETRVVGWDDKAFILEQDFWRGDEKIAAAIVRARFLRKAGGTVAPAEILAMMDYTEATPELPEVARLWNDKVAQDNNP